MSNEFKAFINRGKLKVTSLGERVQELKEVITSLSEALNEEDNDVSLNIINIERGGQDGFMAELKVRSYSKKLFSLYVKPSDDESIYLQYLSELQILNNKDEVINALGEEVSSIFFWKHVEDLKKVSDSLDEIPF